MSCCCSACTTATPRAAATFIAIASLVLGLVGWIPYARISRGDLVEPVVAAIAWLNVRAWRALSATQNGALRRYVAVIGVGLAVIVGFVVLR